MSHQGDIPGLVLVVIFYPRGRRGSCEFSPQIRRCCRILGVTFTLIFISVISEPSLVKIILRPSLVSNKLIWWNLGVPRIYKSRIAMLMCCRVKRSILFYILARGENSKPKEVGFWPGSANLNLFFSFLLLLTLY